MANLHPAITIEHFISSSVGFFIFHADYLHPSCNRHQSQLLATSFLVPFHARRQLDPASLTTGARTQRVRTADQHDKTRTAQYVSQPGHPDQTRRPHTIDTACKLCVFISSFIHSLSFMAFLQQPTNQPTNKKQQLSKPNQPN